MKGGLVWARQSDDYSVMLSLLFLNQMVYGEFLIGS